jgi:hypothetical protein
MHDLSLTAVIWSLFGTAVIVFFQLAPLEATREKGVRVVGVVTGGIVFCELVQLILPEGGPCLEGCGQQVDSRCAGRTLSGHAASPASLARFWIARTLGAYVLEQRAPFSLAGHTSRNLLTPRTQGG